MFKRVAILIIAVFIVSISFSWLSVPVKAGPVFGDITSDTTWDVDKTVTGDVTVKPGVTLTIDAGILVEFDSGMNLIVEGTLNAIGTAGNKITFTSSGAATPGFWGSIHFKAFSTGTIQHSIIEYGTTGIYCFMASPTIQDNLISYNSMSGIECHNYSAPDIINNVITDNVYTGIYLFNHSTALVQDNDVLNSGLYFGIYITSSNAIIENNYVEKNALAGISCDVAYKVGVCNATINNNTVTQNIGDGMYFTSASPRLYNNIVTYNTGNGIVPALSSYARINFNTVQHNEKNGIDSVAVMAFGRPSITNNNVSYNNWSGIHCLSGSHPTISNNEIRSNNETGIKVVAASPRINTNNEITYNKHHGISCNFSSGARITDNNIISGNNRNGIYINNSHPKIENNKITHNDWSGVYLRESSTATIIGNSINNNLKNGISSFSNSKPQIEGSTIIDNGGYGIISTASSLDITNSDVNNNGNDGINLFSNSITVINDTEINGNTGDGIFCKSSSPTINLCSILNNQANAICTDFYSRPLVMNTSITNNNGYDFKVTGNSHPISLNTTLTKSNVNIDSASSLMVQWFMNIKVTNSSAGLIPGAETNVININSIEILNGTTDQNGTIYWVVATEYEEFTAGSRTMYTPHDLSIKKVGYQPHNSLITMDQTKWLEIELNHVPSRPSNFLPVTTHNLTPELQWSPSIEEDLDPVTYHLSLFEGVDNTSTKLIDNAVTTSTSYKIVQPLTFEYGNSYFVELYADDGKGGISPTLAQIIYVVNNNPQAPTLEFIPENPKTGDNLVCNITQLSTDPDLDPVDTVVYTYKWYENNVLQSEYTVENTTSSFTELPSSATTKHELWKCEVTPGDGIGQGVTAKVQTVIQNSAPEIVVPIEDFELDEDTEDSTTINLYTVFNDADNDVLKFKVERIDKVGGFNIKVDIDQATGKVILKPNPNWYGNEKILFYATDNDNAEEFEGVEIKVRSVNDPPILNYTANQSVFEHQWIYINLSAYDNADPKDELDFTCDALDIIPGLRKNKNYIFDKNTGELSILTDEDMIGTYTITVGVTDDNLNGNASQQVEIEVLNKNDPPSALILGPADGKLIGTTTMIDLIGQAADPDLDILSANEQLNYVWKSNLSGILGNELELDDVLFKKGFHKISFIVTDREGLQGKAEINIQVVQITGPGDGPIIENGDGPGPGEGSTDGDKDDETDMIFVYLLVIVIIVLALILTLFVFKLNRSRKKTESVDSTPEPPTEPPVKPEVGAGPSLPEPRPGPEQPVEEPAPPEAAAETQPEPAPPKPAQSEPETPPPPSPEDSEPASKVIEAPTPPPPSPTQPPLTANLISTAPTSDMPTATPITEPSPPVDTKTATSTPIGDGSNLEGEGGEQGDN